MRIINVWKQGKDILAYCAGDGIDAEFSCKEISANGKTYAIADYDILRSLNGSIAAVLKFSGVDVENIPQGVFRVVN